MDPAFKKSLTISASLHISLVLAMFINFSFFRNEEVVVVPLYSSSDAPMQATLMQNPELKESEKPTKKKPEPKPEPKPDKKEPPKPEEPEEDPAEQQELLRKQQQQKEIEVQKKQEEAKRKKEQADLALKKKKEQQKKEQLKKEEEKKKAAAEKKKREDELKKKKEEELKKKKAEALKKKKAEEKRKQQELERAAEEQLMQDELADEADEATRAARQGQLLTEKQRYIAMIVERVRQSWFTDDTMNGKECVVELKLASNGFVTNLAVVGGDEGVCNAAVNAINRVGRFPMPEDPELNEQFRELRLPFKK